MKFFSSRKMSNALCSAFSALAITAVAVGAFNGSFFVPVASANNGLTVSAVPNTGTLTPGQSLEIHVSDPSGTTDAVSDSCLVNNVDVNSTFHNVAPGDYRYTYTVGASDQSRAAGQIPINCTLHQSVSVNITSFDDNNTVAIDTTGGNTGGTTGGTGTTTTNNDVAPTLSMVSLSPNSGTLVAGNTMTATFTEGHSQSDLTLAGDCLINAKDVSASWHSTGGGQYIATYTIQPGDGERPAGHVPISCTMGNSAGTVGAHAWLDGNTVAIDTNGDGTIDNGTSTLGFTISADPSSGTLHAGDSVVVSMQDPLPSGDVVTDGCTVNNVDVAPTYTYKGNGLYQVTYTAHAGDATRAAGQIPFDCRLHNATGSVHFVNFTDNNTLAVDTTTSGGSTGGTGGTGTTTASSTIAFTSHTVPNTGTMTAGSNIETYFIETHGDNHIVLNGACRVNDVDVSGTFANLTDGMYRVIYTVGSNDAERVAGTLPVNCALRDSVTGATATVTTFTDGTNVAVDSNGDGSITPPVGTDSPFISTVSASPSSGTLGAGASLNALIQEGTHDATFTPSSCTINNVDVANSFANLTNGLYRFTYTVGANDAARASGQLPISCTLHNTSGQTISTANGFTDSNTVVIDPTASSTGGTTGTSTGGQIGGDVTGGNTGNNGGTGTTTNGFLHVDSIDQIRDTATAGGGYGAGWAWKFHITVPTNEPSLSMKFADWTHSDGTDHIGAANNMRISSDQASVTSPVSITAAGTYSDAMTITGDLDPNTPGRQIEVTVEMQVPSNTLNGSYTTDYGVKSN